MRIRQQPSTSQRFDASRASSTLRAIGYCLAAGILLVAGYLLGRQTPEFLESPWQTLLALRQRTQSIPSLYLDIPFEDYQQLLSQRDMALQDGANVYSQELDGWGGGQLRFEDETVPLDLRLLAAPASEFSGDRWPIEIYCAESEGCLGMRWAQLHPVADETAVWSAGLLTSMQDMGMPIVSYRWVRLHVNGDAWGLYAVYESPLGMESPVVAMDSTIWLEMLASSGDNVSGITYPYGELYISDVGNAQLVEAQSALHRIVRGEATAITAIDAETWGRYLALRTFWCGSTRPDWRTSAWMYDDASSRLVPIAVPCTPETDNDHALPASFFSDLSVQKSLVQELQVLSTATPQTFQATLTDVTTLYHAAGSVIKDVPTPEQWLEQRQAQVSALLSPTHPLLVRVSSEVVPEVSPSQDLLRLDLINVMSVPVEVLGLDMNENGFIPVEPTWAAFSSVDDALVIPANFGDTPTTVTLRVPASASDVSWDGDIWVVARVWGAEPAESLPQVTVLVQARTP